MYSQLFRLNTENFYEHLVNIHMNLLINNLHELNKHFNEFWYEHSNKHWYLHSHDQSYKEKFNKHSNENLSEYLDKH